MTRGRDGAGGVWRRVLARSVGQAVRSGLGLALALATAPAGGATSVSQVLATDGCLLVLTEERQGLHALCDSGGRWRPVRGLPEIHATRVARAESGRLALATSTGLLLAPGVEGPWSSAGELAASQIVAADASGRRWLVGLFGRGVQRLDWVDDGGALAPLGELPRGLVSSLVPLAGNRTAAAIWGQGVFAVDAEGRVEALGAVAPRSPITALAAATSGTLLAGTLGAGVFRRQAGSASWRRVDEPELRDAQVAALAASPDALLAGTWGQGVWLADADGQSWRRAGQIAEARVSSVAIDSRGRFWAGTPSGLFRSVDQGRTWLPVAFERPDDTSTVAALPRQGLFAVVHGRGLLRSRDAGIRWERIDAVGDASALAVDGGGRLFVGGPDRGVQVSEDGGATWRPHAAGLPDGGLELLRAGPDGVVYAIPAAGEDRQAERMRLYRLGEDDRLYLLVAVLVRETRHKPRRRRGEGGRGGE